VLAVQREFDERVAAARVIVHGEQSARRLDRHDRHDQLQLQLLQLQLQLRGRLRVGTSARRTGACRERGDWRRRRWCGGRCSRVDPGFYPLQLNELLGCASSVAITSFPDLDMDDTSDRQAPYSRTQCWHSIDTSSLTTYRARSGAGT
jgi:hypothetical protein